LNDIFTNLVSIKTAFTNHVKKFLRKLGNPKLLKNFGNKLTKFVGKIPRNLCKSAH